MSGEDPPQREHGLGAIPEPLQDRLQWIVTQDKRPIKPATGWNNPDNQLSFKEARRVAEQHDGEPAYVLHGSDPYVVLDLDDVRPATPTAVSEEANSIVERLDTYTEASRSGRGLHLICEGTRLPDRSEKGSLDTRGALEVYDGGQFIVLTGEQIGPYDTIRDGHAAGSNGADVLRSLQQRYLPTQSEPPETTVGAPQFDLFSVSGDSVSVSHQDVKRTLEEYAKSEHHKAQRALKRWNSLDSSDLGFPSASEADMALVADLAFWCNEDANLMDDCFQASNRMRSKWDEVHYADGRTYGDGTIQTAIRTNYDVFSGNYVRHQ